MLMSRKHQGRYRIIGHRDLHTRKDLRFLRVVLLLRYEALLEHRLQLLELRHLVVVLSHHVRRYGRGHSSDFCGHRENKAVARHHPRAFDVLLFVLAVELPRSFLWMDDHGPVIDQARPRNAYNRKRNPDAFQLGHLVVLTSLQHHFEVFLVDTGRTQALREVGQRAKVALSQQYGLPGSATCTCSVAMARDLSSTRKDAKKRFRTTRARCPTMAPSWIRSSRPYPPALPPLPCKLRYPATDGTWSQETSVDARQCVLRNLERDLAWWRTERSSRCNRPRSPDVDGTLCRVRAQDRLQVLTNMMLLRSSNGRLSARILLDPGDVRGPMRHWPARPIAALQQLSALQQRIDDGTLPPLPNFTAIINPADQPLQDARTDWCGLVPVLSNSRVSGENRDLMMPDFSFAPFSYLTNSIGANMSATLSVPRGWPEEREAIYRAGRRLPYQQKRRSLFWRGGQTHELRRVYSEAIASGRVKLQGGIDADVRLCGTGHCSLSDGVAPEAWCDHQQLLSLPGHSFAVGFKYTLLCSSLVVRGAYDPPVPCGKSACPKTYEQFWHAGLKDGEHFLTSHVVEDLPDAVRRANARPDGSLIASRAADYAYTVLDPEFISEYWHALLAGYAGLFDWDDPELALAPAMCARQPRTRWLNQAEHVCFRGARLGHCYMKLMGTSRDQDFVPIPSTQSMAEQCATTAGMQDLYRSFASVLPVRFAGGAPNVSEAARSALQAWKEGSFKKVPKNKLFQEGLFKKQASSRNKHGR